MRRASAAVLLGLLSLVPSTLAAQSARGVVVDAAQTPVAGVLVLLLDDAAREVARALTNERGEYRIVAPGAGTYRIRTMRIGFRPTTSDPIQLAAGQDAVRQLALADVQISLDTMRVIGRNACSVRPDTAAATYALWEQVRTALTATQLTTGNRSLNARLVSYQRTLDPGRRRRVLRQTAEVLTGLTSRPWNSLSADSLRKVGYVVDGVDGQTAFYAPDIGVLLSESFIEDHCFRIAPASDVKRIGIAFEPTRERRNVAEIRGTLWLDRATSELRGMDFVYDNLSQHQQTGEPGGQLEFARMRNGAWMISRWNIQMPVLELRDEVVTGMGGVVGSRARRTEAFVKEIRVEGGSLALVMRGGDTLWTRPPLALSGVVRDSASGANIVGGLVRLRGTGTETTTDAAGKYSIPDVLPGEYTLEVSSPELKRLGGIHTLTLTFADSSQTFDVRVPTPEQMLGALCRGSGGVVAGSVVTRGDSMPPRPVRVVAEWVEFQPRATEILRVQRSAEATSDARGAFRFCNAPVNTAMSLRVESDSGAAAPVEVSIAPGERITTAELVLDPGAPGQAVLMGVVMSDVNSAPIPDAEVALPELGKNAYTDSLGRYRLSGLAPGTHAVAVRRVGYRPTTSSVDLKANQRLERSLLLSKAQVLDPVTVEAGRLGFASFEENRRFGMGHFLTRAELATQEERRLSDVLSTVPGMTVVMNGGVATAASGRRVKVHLSRILGAAPNDMRRMPTQGHCYAQVYLNGGLIYRGEPDEQPFDLNSVPVNQIEGIEFYNSSGIVPARYTMGKPTCGVLVIHTRKTDGK